MNKVVASAEYALADMPDGATVALAGFGLSHRFPNTLLHALREKGTKHLTLVCNSLGNAGEKGQLLVENRQVKKIMVSFSVRPGVRTPAEAQIIAGDLEVELMPQGIMVERCRAGGAGIPAFYSPTGVDTDLALGKDVRYFNGKPHVLEHAIHLDYALLSGYRADRAGNVQLRGGARNFNPSFAKAARIAIIEVDEIVETGEIPSDLIDLPGIFIDRVVQNTQFIDPRTLSRSGKRAADTARNYLGKPGLTRAAIARNAAKILRDDSYVNLGTGIPTQVSNYLEGRGVWLHAENGVLGYGGIVTGDAIDPDVYNASGQFVQAIAGTSYFDSVTSFEMARGGHIDAVILGAYEVDQDGNVANWSLANAQRGGIGGAMDLVAGDAELIIVLEHRDSKDRPKLRRHCTFPLTARRRVNWVVTDLAVLHWVDGRFVLEAIAPGFTVEEITDLTEMKFDVGPTLAVMETA
jgi:3-oxoacid CoA-transferase